MIVKFEERKNPINNLILTECSQFVIGDFEFKDDWTLSGSVALKDLFIIDIEISINKYISTIITDEILEFMRSYLCNYVNDEIYNSVTGFTLNKYVISVNELFNTRKMENYIIQLIKNDCKRNADDENLKCINKIIHEKNSNHLFKLLTVEYRYSCL